MAQDVGSFVARCCSRSEASTGAVPKMPPANHPELYGPPGPSDRAAPRGIGRAPACSARRRPATVPAARPETPRRPPDDHGEEAMPEFETLGYEESEGVAWVTLNRPDVMNAFNPTMQRELR